MNRKEFIQKAAYSTLSILGLTMLSCESKTEDPNNASVTIDSVSDNHGHNSVNMTGNDVDALNVQLYTVSGGGHDHTFTPTLQEMETLKSGTAVTFSSSGSGHTHDVTLSYSS